MSLLISFIGTHLKNNEDLLWGHLKLLVHRSYISAVQIYFSENLSGLASVEDTACILHVKPAIAYRERYGTIRAKYIKNYHNNGSHLYTLTFSLCPLITYNLSGNRARQVYSYYEPALPHQSSWCTADLSSCRPIAVRGD